MLDPIFNLLAGLLEWFYSLVPSYGFAIIALTTLVLIILSPLTYRSTKSMVSMRRLQPQVKRLQKKHKNDREQLNKEMMALYQEHNVSPLSGCLPILIQSPVFIVMFRVLRGITRRSSDAGFASGGSFARRIAGESAAGPGEAINVDLFTDTVSRNFNPEYLHREAGNEAEMYLDLVQANKMDWIGLDLSRSPWEVLQDGIGAALPYLVMVVLVAVLGWYQQRQIQGRMTGEVSAQQQMIMRIIPWMLPVFSFTMPAGLVLYFIVSAILRIAQQAYITRSVYENEELNKPIEFDNDDDDDDDDETMSPRIPLQPCLVAEDQRPRQTWHRVHVMDLVALRPMPARRAPRIVLVHRGHRQTRLKAARNQAPARVQRNPLKKSRGGDVQNVLLHK